MNFPSRLPSLLAVLGALLLAGCRTVDTGPSTPPDPNQQQQIIGKEPAPAPIPQKDDTSGDSSLSHKKPDQRIDRP